MSLSQAVLVINSGSSSIKYQYIDPITKSVLAKGLIGKIGASSGEVEFTAGNYRIKESTAIADHHAGIAHLLTLLKDVGYDVIHNPPIGIGHRVVNGGPDLYTPTIVTASILDTLRSFVDLAPLHTPANILGIECFFDLLPQVPNVAVFDTGFFHHLPRYNSTYAIDAHLSEKFHIRKYGFHGTSHSYVAHHGAQVLHKPISECNFVIFHIGNGASASAIKGGKPIDTSMGLTPLEGLVMGTRSGDIDPAIVGYLCNALDKDAAYVVDLLNCQSGLKGLTGSNDLRDVHAAAQLGDEQAQLACEIYVQRIRKYLGAYWLELGTVDAIIFTAGVGENAAWLRAAVLAELEGWGIILDPEANNAHSSQARIITSANSQIPVLVIPTNEELAIAEDTYELINKNPTINSED